MEFGLAMRKIGKLYFDGGKEKWPLYDKAVEKHRAKCRKIDKVFVLLQQGKVSENEVAKAISSWYVPLRNAFSQIDRSQKVT
jgi:hypothetical protein